MACDDLQLIDFSKEDDNLIATPIHDFLEDLRISLTFDNANIHVRPVSLKPRRLSFLRKSLDWGTAFFTTKGLLNPEELCEVNKGFKKSESKRPSSRTRKDVQTRRVSKAKIARDPDSRSLKPQGSKGMPNTRIKDQQIAYNAEKNSKGYRLDGLSSSASLSKCVGRKIKPRNTSPKSVLSPLSSTCSSSSLSPARRFDNALLTADFQSPLQVVGQNFNERKLTGRQYATRSSSIRNNKSSGLKMPSPRIGFFDEQPLQPFNLFPVSTENCPKVSTSCTKPKIDGETHRGRSRNRLNIEGKFQKNDTNTELSDRWSSQKSRKKNKQRTFEDQLNGLNRQSEVLNIDSNVTDVRGQQSCSRPADQLSIPPASEDTTTPCSRTPWAEKMLLTSDDNVNSCDCMERFKGANSRVQSEPVKPRRVSFCRKSLEWDSAFFSNAGLLNAEELCLVNRGFRAVEPDQRPSSRTKKHVRRHTVADWNQTSLDGNGFHGKTLKGNVFKNPADSHPSSPVMKTNPEQFQKPHYKTRLKLMTQRFKRST